MAPKAAAALHLAALLLAAAPVPAPSAGAFLPT